jgi:hypothetical protein
MTTVLQPYIGAVRTEETPAGIVRCEADYRWNWRILGYGVWLIICQYWSLTLPVSGVILAVILILSELLASPKIVEVNGDRKLVLRHRRYFGLLSTAPWLSTTLIADVYADTRPVMETASRSGRRAPTGQTAHEVVLVLKSGEELRLFEGSPGDQDSARLIARVIGRVIGMAPAFAAVGHKNPPRRAEVIEQRDVHETRERTGWLFAITILLFGALIGFQAAALSQFEREHRVENAQAIETHRCRFSQKVGKNSEIVKVLPCAQPPAAGPNNRVNWTVRSEVWVNFHDKTGTAIGGPVYLEDDAALDVRDSGALTIIHWPGKPDYVRLPSDPKGLIAQKAVGLVSTITVFILLAVAWHSWRERQSRDAQRLLAASP